MHRVRDGSRTLQFEGELLAESTSKRAGSHRWVEFQLYRTQSGSYVLSRVGVSSLYHDSTCALVNRYGLKSGTPGSDGIPCEMCMPDPLSQVYVERPRYWAQVSDSAEAVIDALYRHDDGGVRYMTLVAQRLVNEAGQKDRALNDAYRVEYVR